MAADIDRIKMKCKELGKAAKMIDDDINESMKFVEEKQNLSYIIKGNRLKRDSDKTKECISVLQKEVLEVEEKKEIERKMDILNKRIPNGHLNVQNQSQKH